MCSTGDHDASPVDDQAGKLAPSWLQGQEQLPCVRQRGGVPNITEKSLLAFNVQDACFSVFGKIIE